MRYFLYRNSVLCLSVTVSLKFGLVSRGIYVISHAHFLQMKKTNVYVYVYIYIFIYLFTSINISLINYNKIIFMFVPCINSIKALFYYSKLMHTIIKSKEY